MKTGDFVGLFRSYLPMNERVQIIWLDQQYLLLHFPSEEISKKIQEDYQNLHSKRVLRLLKVGHKEEKFGFHSFTILPYQKYEELCGARKPAASLKREAPQEEVTVFETKRFCLSRIKRPEKQSKGCQII